MINNTEFCIYLIDNFYYAHDKEKILDISNIKSLKLQKITNTDDYYGITSDISIVYHRFFTYDHLCNIYKKYRIKKLKKIYEL